MTRSLSGLILRVEKFEFAFEDFTLTGEWYKWRTTSPQYQRKKAEKIAALPSVTKEMTTEDAEKTLAQVEKDIRAINAQIMKDTIKSWDAVEEFSAMLDRADYEQMPPRIQALYRPASNAALIELGPGKEVEAEAAALTYELIDPKLADGPQPVPLTVEVFEELPAFFSRMLGEYFHKKREEVLNPTQPNSSQNG